MWLDTLRIKIRAIKIKGISGSFNNWFNFSKPTIPTINTSLNTSLSSSATIDNKLKDCNGIIRCPDCGKALEKKTHLQQQLDLAHIFGLQSEFRQCSCKTK